jgi:hypothetical protein
VLAIPVSGGFCRGSLFITAHARGHIYVLNRSINIGFVRISYVRSYYFCKIHTFYLENRKGRHYLGEAGVGEWIIVK